jgi:hypothetical protein
MPFSEENRQELLRRVFWDKSMDVHYVLELLNGAPERFPEDRDNLYRRLLTTYDWYTLLNLIAVDRLKNEAVSESVVGRLFPKDLREKYRYALKVLSDETVSSSRRGFEHH